jgi:Ni/Co efflux regulator RcnB
VKHMLAAGMAAEQIVLAVADMEAAIPSSDPTADRRRAWDRERKRKRNSTGIPPEPVENAEKVFPDKGPPDPLKLTLSKDPPSPPKGGSSPTQFATFWLAYPAKTGKRAAETAFDRAFRRIVEPDPLGVMLAALERAKTSRKWNDGFIPNPATWLNQDRWNDEEPEQINGRTPQINGKPADREDRIRRMHAGALAAIGGGGEAD